MKFKSKKIIIILSILMLTILGMILLIGLGQGIINLFIDILGRSFYNSILLQLFWVLFVLGIIYAAFYWGHKEDGTHKTKMNHWKHITIYLMILLLCLGFFLIHNYVGKQNLDSILRDFNNDNLVVGELDCESSSGYYQINDRVTCSFTPKLTNVSGTIEQNYINGQERRDLIDGNLIKFNGRENVNLVSFFIQGYDTEGTYRSFTAGKSFNFISLEEVTRIKDRFILYMLGLLGVVFFSVPSMMFNLKKIFENKK